MRQRLAVIVILALAGLALYLGPVRLPPLPLDLESETTKTEAPRTDRSASEQTATAANTAAAKPEHDKAPEPALDIARISPEGPSVFAGQAAPFEAVTVLENGKPIGTAKADANGEWTLVTDHKFASTDSVITLRADVAPVVEAGAAPEVRSAGAPAQQPAGAPPNTVTAYLQQQFEGLVAAARKDADHQDAGGQGERASSATAPPPKRLAEARPSVNEVPTAAAPPAGSVTSIPVPMTFVYNEATLTEDGRHTVALLLEYLKLKQFNVIALSGHADERGSDEYNMDLSRQRLETVARALREGGYTGKVDLRPKGKSEPFTGVDRSKFALEDLYQLDRRVELRAAQ